MISARFITLATALMLLGTIAAPAAAAFPEHAELRVRGTIRPSACSIALSDNGTVDYGGMPASALIKNRAGGLKLEQREIVVSVVCELGTLIGISVRDNRPGTHANFGDISVFGFGLGLVEDARKLGAYTITPAARGTSELGDVALLVSDDNGKNWQANGRRSLRNDGLSTMSWAEPGKAAPTARRSVKLPLMIDTYLYDPQAQLRLDKAIELDGSATLTLVYL